MYTTDRLLRIAKIFSVFSIGVMFFLIVLNNTTDYYTNYGFVEHVMKMDTTFPASNVHYRSMANPIIFHVGYILIITIEFVTAVLCLWGSCRMFRNLKNDSASFHASKNMAVTGIISGLTIFSSASKSSVESGL